MLHKVKYVGSGNLDGINNSTQCFESQTFEFPKFKIARNFYKFSDHQKNVWNIE